MFRYVRRADFSTVNVSRNNTDTALLEHPIIGYCNWSFDKKNHISETQLVDALHRFSRRYVPYYVRLFNETPPALLEDFVESHNISDSEIQRIYSNITRGSKRKISRNFFDFQGDESISAS